MAIASLDNVCGNRINILNPKEIRRSYVHIAADYIITCGRHRSDDPQKENLKGQYLYQCYHSFVAIENKSMYEIKYLVIFFKLALRN